MVVVYMYRVSQQHSCCKVLYKVLYLMANAGPYHTYLPRYGIRETAWKTRYVLAIVERLDSTR